MECTEARDLLIAHARDELSEPETAKLREHLGNCPTCAAELEVARRMLSTARAANPRRVAEWAEEIMRRAAAGGNSDIHLDPGPDGLVVRFRHDGLLKEAERHERTAGQALTDGFLRLAGLPAEAVDAARRRPVSGRILRVIEGAEYDFRLAGFPMIDGPKLVMRVYSPPNRRVGLDELGLSREDQGRLERWRVRPNGLVLIAGPIGSGRSTTQYALLERNADAGANTIAVERHPLARLPYVQHALLDPAAGLGHAEALRALMRCDPDVVMLDEAPDRETAVQLADVAVTGHLVIAGVEAGRAVAAIRRLLDLGTDPWTLSQTLVGVSAQRLGRRICPDCRVERAAPARSLQALGWEPGAAPPTFAGEGCERCRKQGYRGRVGFFELLEVTPAVAARIAENAPADAITAAAGDALTSLAADARRKVADGLVPVDEALRVVRRVF